MSDQVEQRVQLQRPTKRTTLRPLGIGVERVGDEVHVQLLISPFEYVTVELDAESKAVLQRQLSGGIVQATLADVPHG